MKKLAWICGLALAPVAVWLVAQSQAGVKPLSEITPAGALVYLEARNLGSLVGEWNTSREKTAWLASDNYKVFERSKLYLRLQDASNEYSAVAGFPPDMNLITSIAGGESALAVYDVSNLEFLYLTRLPSARALESVLFKNRDKFTTRQSGGTTYYVKNDPQTKRTAAFALQGDLLILATREELIGQTLGLIAGQGSAVRVEPWFQQAVAATTPAGDVRMVVNMDRSTRTGAFRTYWVHQNVTELRQYSAAIVDLHRAAGEWREQRVLLRSEPKSAADSAAVAALRRLAPADAGSYEARTASSSDAAELIAEKILRAGSRFTPPPSQNAPRAASLNVSEEGESDLETRIDQPVEAGESQADPAVVLEAWLRGKSVQAMLQVENARRPATSVFVTVESAVAIESAANWNADDVRSALSQLLDKVHSTGGVSFRSRQAGSDAVWELDGLAPLSFAVKGRTLVLSNTPALMNALLARFGTQPGAAAARLSGYRHAPEIANFARATQPIESVSRPADSNEPLYFAGNLGSLARVLGRLQSVSVTTLDDGRQVKETVSYRLGQ